MFRLGKKMPSKIFILLNIKNISKLDTDPIGSGFLDHPDPDPYLKNRIHGPGSGKKGPDPLYCCKQCVVVVHICPYTSCVLQQHHKN